MTRDLEWGVRLPKELGEKWEKKVMYVWVSWRPVSVRSGRADLELAVRRPDRIPFDYGQLHA